MNHNGKEHTLIIATRNAHKVQEIRTIVGPAFNYVTLRDLPGAPEIVEDAPTFSGNATKKAVTLARWLAAHGPQLTHGQPIAASVIADDSGLEVDALNGAPGVHSARFAALDGSAKGNSSDADNNVKLLRLLEGAGAPKRTARFRCVIALTPVLSEEPGNASPVCYADAYELATRLFEGVCEGRIDFVPRGKGGFGYDPLFVPDGFDLSFAELGEETKNRISHRSRALQALRRAWGE